MEHIFNCHGEWLLVFQALATLPVVGAYLRSLFLARRKVEERTCPP